MTQKYNVPWNGRCTACRAEKAYIGFKECECVNENCSNYSEKQKRIVDAFELALKQIEEHQQNIDAGASYKQKEEQDWGEYDDFIYNVNGSSNNVPPSAPNIWGPGFNLPLFNNGFDDSSDDQSNVKTLPPPKNVGTGDD